MKNLSAYSNTQKARLLHQLFPEEMAAFLEFTSNLCQTIKEDEDQNRKDWKNGLFTFDFWLQLINQIEDNISSSGSKLNKSSSHFAIQLFDGYLACFSIYTLQLFTTVRLHPNKKFTLAVDLLFND